MLGTKKKSSALNSSCFPFPISCFVLWSKNPILGEAADKDDKTAETAETDDISDVDTAAREFKISVPASDWKQSNGSHDKKHFCSECKKDKLQIRKHLRVVHGKKGTKAEANWGDHKKNLEVIAQGSGVLRVARYPPVEEDGSRYVPCLVCYLWMKSSKFSKHSKACSSETSMSGSQNKAYKPSRKASKALILGHKQGLKPETIRLLGGLQNDPISRVVLSDPLLKEFAVFLSQKMVNSNDKRVTTLRINLRNAGRFVHEARYKF